ncbi:MAG: 30S ribosomal protein S14 [Alphaproteobacteria bacterium]|nr:30S ribosomal protein S14 [Alphaproteobacteria bacterium]
MAKKSSIEKNEMRRRLSVKYDAKRTALLEKTRDMKLPPEERFAAQLKLAKLPRNSSRVRIRNRCGLTGRPRAYYRKFNLSRIALRDLASAGRLPGAVKASW